MNKLLLLILVICASCAHYQFGTALPKQYRIIEVSPVENYTSEPQLESFLRNSLAEQIIHTPGIKLSAPNQSSGLVLMTQIRDFDQQRHVSARLLEHNDEDHSGNVYQTVIFKILVNVEYQAFANDSETPYRAGLVSVEADYPMMADQETARGEAFREAMRCAAQQIVAEVTEE